MVWDINAPQGNESGKIKWEIVKWTRGTGLDLGCGIQKTYPHFIGVDSGKDGVLFGHPINPDVRVKTAADLPMFANASMDFVFSSHLLEHFPLTRDDPRTWDDKRAAILAEKLLLESHTAEDALREWMRVLKVDGYLVLYVPDEDTYPKVGQPGANPDHCFNVNFETVMALMRSTGTHWDLLEYQERSEGNEYSLFFVFQKKNNKHRESWPGAPWRNKDLKRAAVVRYGAYGDLLQTSSVLAGLKAQGYHVTLFTSPPGHEVIAHDPNLDELYLQDKDQVPNHLLGEFWGYHKRRFDKWVQLSESVEVSLLVNPGKTIHGWPPAARHAVLNRNYLEIQHLIAGVPHVPQVRFFPTETEAAWARKERASLLYGRSSHEAFQLKGRLVMWALSGSSVHKTWGGLDQAIARILLTFPACHLVLVGGNDCVILEQGWEKEPRVHQRCGRYSIRQTLSLVQKCDVVIGPETGVLNAVSQDKMPKVLFLSHSTHENLSRDWVNVYALASKHTVCPGRGNNEAPACHQLHYSWEFCQQYLAPDDPQAGTAQCQRDIDEEGAWDAIRWAIGSTYPELAQLTKEAAIEVS